MCILQAVSEQRQQQIAAAQGNHLQGVIQIPQIQAHQARKLNAMLLRGQLFMTLLRETFSLNQRMITRHNVTNLDSYLADCAPEDGGHRRAAERNHRNLARVKPWKRRKVTVLT